MATNVDLRDSSYEGASATSRKMRNWQPALVSADAALCYERSELIKRCRDAYRNYPIAKAAVDRLVHNAIGTGLSLQIKLAKPPIISESEALQISQVERELEKRFNAWSAQADFYRMLSFCEMQALCLLTVLLSGDILANLLVVNGNLQIQLVESDRVSNPNWQTDTNTLRDGVELDAVGKPLAYWILEQHPGDLNPSYQWEKFNIFVNGIQQIYQIYRCERPAQHRGVPFLSPILGHLRLLEKYSEAELIAAVVAGYLSVFVKSNSNGFAIEENSSTGAKEVTGLAPGMVLPLQPGEDIIPVNPARPNAQYQPFVYAILQQIGAALGVSVEYLLMSFNASYSASRASVIQAWRTVMIYRNMIVERFCEPVFWRWCALNVPSEIAKDISTHWVGPAKTSLDDYKEILAAEKRIQLGISSRQEETEELRETDWADVAQQLRIEETMRKKSGLSESQETIETTELEQTDEPEPKDTRD